MDFPAFLENISRLEKINKEMQETKSPEYLEAKSKEIFPDEIREKISRDLLITIDNILQA